MYKDQPSYILICIVIYIYTNQFLYFKDPPCFLKVQKRRREGPGSRREIREEAGDLSGMDWG